MSFWTTIATDSKKVFAFLTSSKVQAVVAAGESVAEDVDPALTGAFTIFNNWFMEIFKAQALGASAAAGSTTDTGKAALVLQTLTPQVLAFAKSQGQPVTSSATILQINNSLVNALELLSGGTTANTATTPQSGSTGLNVSTTSATAPISGTVTT